MNTEQTVAVNHVAYEITAVATYITQLLIVMYCVLLLPRPSETLFLVVCVCNIVTMFVAL